MLFEYRYFGNSEVDSSPVSSGLSFAPDTRREPTFFRGQLKQKLQFRECISALHDVVVSDLRFRPKDRTEYLKWRAQQDEVDLVELAAARKDVKKKMEEARSELNELRHKQNKRGSVFYKARQKYFNWLFKKNYDAWFVLDPVVTVHPDEVFFECFSQDESSYGRVGVNYNVFQELGDFGCGTTNVDYSSALYDEFQKIRDYKETTLEVDPGGFNVATTGEAAYREVKIDLPDTWVRGFLQVSSAMTLPATAIQLHPMDLHNLCFVLRRKKEKVGPRSLRFVLEPGKPVKVRIEPFGIEQVCARSLYMGSSAQEIRVWGRRRLHVLERLIPVAKSFTVLLLGTGMPSFWIADCGDVRFTLGLSGWTANDWSSSGNFDLLAPRADVDSDTSQRVFKQLCTDWRASTHELATKLDLDRGTVESALVQWTQNGRVMYDVDKGLWRRRELTAEPLPMDMLRFSNEREQAAVALLPQVQQLKSNRVDGRITISARIGRDRPELTLDVDQRIKQGTCTCSFFFQNRLRKGPCEHILAARLALSRRQEVGS